MEAQVNFTGSSLGFFARNVKEVQSFGRSTYELLANLALLIRKIFLMF